VKKTLLTLAAALIASVSFTFAASEKPNVILIMVDDQGYGDLACNGNPIIHTPNLDRLSEESIRLTNFHVSPYCAPTRASLMTGRHCRHVGVTGVNALQNLMTSDVPTMAEVFRENGYRTGLFGKWHLGDHYPRRPEERGFDEVVSFGDGAIGVMGDAWNNTYFSADFRHNGKLEHYEDYCTNVWFDEATRFIGESKGKPFFCYIPTNVAHGPFIPPPEYKEFYKGKFGAPFYGMISHLDETLGRFRRFLAEEGLEDNTILIYTSDNGTAGGVTLEGGLNGHEVVAGYNAGMRGMKGSNYDGGHRVPCFIRWPAEGLSGRSVDDLCAHMDILPTLIDLCDLKFEGDPSLDGISFRKLLYGKDDRDNFGDRILVEALGGTVMTPEWRLVNGNELYHIQKDPQQINDLAAEHPDVVRRLGKELEKVNAVNVPYTQFVEVGHDDEWVHLNYEHWLGHPFSWQKSMVYQGEPVNHPYQIKAVREGIYEFALRRWPYSLDKGFDEILESQVKRRQGRKMEIVKARLLIWQMCTEFNESVQVVPGMKKATFRARLHPGFHTVNTWLCESDGKASGAYFMDIRYAGQ
jgi:arylsulfatase A-like enzyme